MPLSPVVRERGRLVAGGVAVGSVATPILVIGLVVVGGFAPLAAAETAFAFGGLWFGLALLGWAGSVASGRAIEAAQERLGADTDWTERRSRPRDGADRRIRRRHDARCTGYRNRGRLTQTADLAAPLVSELTIEEAGYSDDSAF